MIRIDAPHWRAGLASLCVLCMTGAVVAQQDDALVIAGSGWIADAPTHIADVSGYFNSDIGIELRVEYADSGQRALARLIAGEADFALMAAAPLANELLRSLQCGRPRDQWPVVIASIALSNRAHHIVADARRGTERPSDLTDRTIGLLQDSSAHFGWDRFAAYYAIEPDSVTLVDAQPEEWLEGILSGRFDAVVAWTPWSERIEARLGENARAFSLRALDSVSWLLVSKRQVLNQHALAADRVLAGYARALDRLAENPDAALRLVNRSPDDPSSNGVIWDLSLGWSVLANVEANLAWAAARRNMPAAKLVPDEYIERAPLERLRPAAVRLPTWLSARPAGQNQ